MFNQALLTAVVLLIYVWQRRLLWFTHPTVAQLLCRQDDGAAFLPWDPPVEERETRGKAHGTEIKAKHKKTHFVFDQSVISNQSVRIKAYSLSELVQKKSF